MKRLQCCSIKAVCVLKGDEKWAVVGGAPGGRDLQPGAFLRYSRSIDLFLCIERKGSTTK